MMVVSKEKQHRGKREAKAVPMISVAQVTAIVCNAHVAIATRWKKYPIRKNENAGKRYRRAN